MNKLRISIFGAGRGLDIAENMRLLGCEITALCDFNEARLKKGAERLGGDIALYSDFDAFIEHETDAVVLANYFHEHTPYAIKCFERNLHVFSECIANGTLAEGVELIRAFEKSSSVYMLAENYPQMIFNREMKRVCSGGTLGRILYAEGEYNHPVSAENAEFYKSCIYFPEHWRNYLPRSYYITHSLGPVMSLTGATPQRVSAAPVFCGFTEAVSSRYVGDRAAIITTVNDDGSVFRITGCAAFGAHHNFYRVCGSEGQIENIKGSEKILLRYNGWSVPEGKEEVNLYDPSWQDNDEELIKGSGHGGADFITARMFLDCIRENRQPEHPFDIYSATKMSSVAILAHRSILEGGKSFDVPDFRKEADRKMYENDRLSPFFGSDGSKPTIPCCSQTDYKPTDEQLKNYLKMLEE